MKFTPPDKKRCSCIQIRMSLRNAIMIADILLRFRKIFGGPPKGDPSEVMNQKMEDMRQGRY